MKDNSPALPDQTRTPRSGREPVLKGVHSRIIVQRHAAYRAGNLSALVETMTTSARERLHAWCIRVARRHTHAAWPPTGDWQAARHLIRELGVPIPPGDLLEDTQAAFDFALRAVMIFDYLMRRRIRLNEAVLLRTTGSAAQAAYHLAHAHQTATLLETHKAVQLSAWSRTWAVTADPRAANNAAAFSGRIFTRAQLRAARALLNDPALGEPSD
ncbi:MAG: hypothetical protein GYB64_11665 [Chloroflexi bacterium]|nr:hypothetical protein [Chloroflexota bacterium]